MALTGDVYESANAKDQGTERPSALTEAALAEHDNATSSEVQNTEAETAEEGEVASSEVGAGVLAGVTGLLLGGPIIGTLTGAIAYYLASNDDDIAGETARSAGDWAIKTSMKAAEAAKEVDEQHHITDRVKDFFSSAWDRVRQFDENHRSFVKETVSEAGAKATEFERKHHIVENILLSIKSGVDFLLEKLGGMTTPTENSVENAETSSCE